jgi:hypothetical protein
MNLITTLPRRSSADFQVCCIAGFLTCESFELWESLENQQRQPIWKSAILAPRSKGASASSVGPAPSTPRGEQVVRPALG